MVRTSFSSLCSFEISDDLKACSGCLSVSYAGREEQRSHWKRHKAVCKVLKRFCGELDTERLRNTHQYSRDSTLTNK